MGQQKKDDLADVARTSFDAMVKGETVVISGFKNTIQAAVANGMPADMLAEQHRTMAEPRSGE